MIEKVKGMFSSRRRHTRCALVTGVQTCALPILVQRQTPRAAFPFGQQFSMIILQRHGLGSIGPDMFSAAFQISHSPLSATVTGTANRTNRLFPPPPKPPDRVSPRSEEHTSELQSLMRISSAVFCLKTKK